MGRLSFRPLLTRYAVATTFLLLVAVGNVVTTLLAPRQAAALRLWASTDIVNLHHHPVSALVLSAFLVSGSPLGWLVLIAFAMFAANRALGNPRLALVCMTGHVIGTAVSEGIVAYRVGHGALPVSSAHLIDIGPSFVVVAAITAAAIFGPWPARLVSVTAFAELVFGGHIFAGLTSLDVAAIGHMTAMVTAVILAFPLRGALRAAQADATLMLPAVVPSIIRGGAQVAPYASTAWAPPAGQDAVRASQDQSCDPAA